jgi:hypothetical protein
MNQEPIALKVIDVRNGRYTGRKGKWICDVTFGIDSDTEQNDPTITVTSDDVGKYPQVGDIMLVYPPRVAGYLIQKINHRTKTK